MKLDKSPIIAMIIIILFFVTLRHLLQKLV